MRKARIIGVSQKNVGSKDTPFVKVNKGTTASAKQTAPQEGRPALCCTVPSTQVTEDKRLRLEGAMHLAGAQSSMLHGSLCAQDICVLPGGLEQ